MILSHAPSLCSKSRKEKTKKRNINNDLAIFPSHDTEFVRAYYWIVDAIGLEFELCLDH